MGYSEFSDGNYNRYTGDGVYTHNKATWIGNMMINQILEGSIFTPHMHPYAMNTTAVTKKIQKVHPSKKCFQNLPKIVSSRNLPRLIGWGWLNPADEICAMLVKSPNYLAGDSQIFAG